MFEGEEKVTMSITHITQSIIPVDFPDVSHLRTYFLSTELLVTWMQRGLKSDHCFEWNCSFFFLRLSANALNNPYPQ